MLKQTELLHYHKHGYVHLPALVPEARLVAYEQRFEQLALSNEAPPKDLKVMRDIMVAKGAVDPATPMHAVNKIMNFEADSQLYGYTLEPELLSAVRSIICADTAEDLFSISTNVFNKPPGVDGRHPMHQDLRYFRIRPATKIVASWTAINPTTRENGCLAVLPGSHNNALHQHGNPDWDYVNAGFFAIEDIDLQAREHVEMAPGDTLLFHPLLVHGSGRNRSSSFRRAISTHYAAASCTSETRDWHVGKQARRISTSPDDQAIPPAPAT